MDNENEKFKMRHHIPQTKEGYIGSHLITFSEILSILFKMTKNWYYNLFHDKKRYMKIWAITDNRNNYDIYIED